MAKLSPARRLLKLIHPEGIPALGAIAYGAFSRSTIFQQHYELVARHVLSCSSGESLLDVGTGPGWLLFKLHEHAPGLGLVGVDISPSMVAQATKNVVQAGLSGTIEVRDGDARSLPFEEGSFDVVVSTGSVHHWKDVVGGLNEVHRVLKPGGKGLIYDIVSDTPGDVLRSMVGEFGRLRIALFWLHAFEEPSYSQAAFEELGRSSSFASGSTCYVGVLCCLQLTKGVAA
jgi:ubiquinone/menaquinone biosynthesis C-methylase UbiE